MAGKKKDFSSTQLNKFLESTNIEDTVEDIASEFAEDIASSPNNDKGQQATPLKIAKKKKAETKSKRVNLLIKPSLYKQAVKQANRLGYNSFNDFINSLLEQVVEGE